MIITFNADTLERVDFPGGYFDGSGKIHYNITDWQGNVVMVVNNTGRPVQRVSYYPYGEPHREPAGQRYLYSGKERQNFLSSGAYDFHARQYSPALNQWYAPDRHAADYADISPYVFCGANPIKYIDPSGNDYFIFNDTGHLISREPNKDEDIIAITKQNGLFEESDAMAAGTIQSTYDIKIANGDYTTIKIRGDKEAKSIFEFFAENTKIEFSQFVCGIEGPSGLNFITTSHEEDTERGFGYLFLYQLQYGYNIRKYIHNHPSGRNSISKDKDIKTAKVLSRFMPAIELFLFAVPPNEEKGHYYKYNSKTKPSTALPIYK